MHLTFLATRRAAYISYIIQGVSNNLSPLLFIIFNRDFNLSYEMLGTIILINFGTQLIVDVLGAKICDKVGFHIPIVAAHVLSAAGLVMLSVLPFVLNSVYAALIVATVFTGAGGGLIEVLVGPIVNSIPSPEHKKASAMSLLHSFYGWGQVLVILVSTLTLSFVGYSKWYILPLMWAVIPALNTFLFLVVPIPKLQIDKRQSGFFHMLKIPLFITLLFLMLCAGACEIIIAQWSSLFAEQGLHLSKVWGDIAGPCMFALLMVAGRTFYGIFGAKIKLLNFMTLMAGLCTVCYLLAGVSKNPALSLAGCALCGLGVCMMWPGTISFAAKTFPLAGAAMFGLMAMAGDIGCAVAPWLASVVAQHSKNGLQSGILAGTIFPAAMFVILIFLQKREKSLSS